MSQDDLTIPIASLPLQLSYDEAVEAAYREDLDWIEEKLRAGLSVLIECDKQLSNYLYKALRKRFRAQGRQRLRLLAGHGAPPTEEGPGGGGMMQAQTTLQQRLLAELSEAIFGARQDEILALTHLDILTTTTRSGLGVEAREAAAIMYENPDMVFLGFKDPAFEIPNVIEKVFAVKYDIMGIARDKLRGLILQREARKFGVERVNPYALYKYVSGLNAVRCRQVLAPARRAAPTSIRANAGRRRRDLPRHPPADLAWAICRGAASIDSGARTSAGTSRGEAEDPRPRCSRCSAHQGGLHGSESEVRAIEELIPKGMIFSRPARDREDLLRQGDRDGDRRDRDSIVSGP